MWWFLYGLVMGAGIVTLIFLVRDGNREVSWYVWLLGAIALLLVSLTLQHFFASRKEMEYKAAWMGIVVMGIPAVIFGPGSISQAHTEDEFVEIEQLKKAARVYSTLMAEM